MKTTTITMHSGFEIGKVDPRIFGGFLEHLGRAVYQGVYDPESLQADEEGFRKDVLAALRGLEMTVMRYPGGNFASGYHWRDGVGPRDERPAVRELAWQSIEPNLFGTDEFVALCRKVNWAPMMTVNLGTGTPKEARDWVEYCNCPTGSQYADMRARNGSEDPYGIKLWCLGNEMDGPWQLGHVPADQYAIRAQQAAKMMKDVDPSIELVACGSCSVGLPTYMEWDRRVLEYVGDLADYVSLHRYVGNRDDDTPDFLAVTSAVDRQIEEMDAVCRYVQAKRRSTKRTYLCFDEWNVWYRCRGGDGEGQFAPHLLEEVYNLEDALVVAGFMNSFVRHADVVKIANLAQIVNVIAPIMTRDDEMLVQSIYYPFQMFARRGRGVSLALHVDGPHYESKTYGHVPFVDASAIRDGGTLYVFAVNRALDDTAIVEIEMADEALASLQEGEVLTAISAKSANSFDQPDTVAPRTLSEIKIAQGEATVALPPLSFTAMTFDLV